MYIHNHRGTKFPFNNVDITDDYNDLLRSSNSDFMRSTRNIRISLLLLIYSALVHNYSYGLMILWMSYNTDKDKQSTRLHQIREYRKLSPLFDEIQKPSYHLKDKTEFLLETKKTVILPIVQSYYKKIIVPKRKDNSKFLRNTPLTPMDLELANQIKKNIESVDWMSAFANFTSASENKDLVLDDPILVTDEGFNDDPSMSLVEASDALSTFLQDTNFNDMAKIIAEKAAALTDEEVAKYKEANQALQWEDYDDYDPYATDED